MKFGGVYVFKEKNIEKKGKEKKKAKSRKCIFFFIEKKAYRDKFYLVA